jgi:hypothetical protein
MVRPRYAAFDSVKRVALGAAIRNAVKADEAAQQNHRG